MRKHAWQHRQLPLAKRAIAHQLPTGSDSGRAWHTACGTSQEHPAMASEVALLQNWKMAPRTDSS
ncbi:hypothetical protein CQ010_12210 [Arthrobacter sp. MYb211]|nr:hypothetical protein CQ015_01940 [Arthrobacter sp. MYb221]PRC06584.1 hypothetical protein CQ010_12210 [Arthrobacter sp. MYb211]